MPLQAHVGIGLRASQDVLPCGTAILFMTSQLIVAICLCSCMPESVMCSKI